MTGVLLSTHPILLMQDYDLVDHDFTYKMTLRQSQVSCTVALDVVGLP